MGINTAAVQRLYLAYFNRPADPVGLAYWEGQLSSTVAATQAQLAAIAAGFSGSAEYAALYAGQSNAQIVDNLYLNLFGRHAETAGLISWAGQLTAGTQTFASIALQLTYSAQGTDATAIANKLAASTAFSTALDTSAEIIGYSGTAAAASARAWLATVTNDAATLTAATASTDTAVASAVTAGTSAQGTSFTLTSGVDTFTGGPLGDTFNAVSATTGGTWTAGDVLDGGTGTDTLNLTVANAGAGFSAASVRATNIENLRMTNADSGNALTYAESALNSFTNIADVSGGSGGKAVSVTGATTLGTYSMENSAAAHTFTVTHTAATTAGTADAVTVSLNNAGTKTAASTFALTTDATGTNVGVETLNIQTTGAASYLAAITATDSSTSTIKTINVSGSQDLTVTTALDFAGTGGTLNASAFTGKLNVGFDTTEDGSVVGGAGNDTFNFTSGLSANDTVDGGAGTDTLRVSTSLTSTMSNIKNVETLQADGGTSFSATAITGLTTVNLAAANLGATVSNNSSKVTVGALANQSALTLTASASGGAANLALDNSTATVANAGIDVAALTLTNIDTLNVNSTGGNLATGAMQKLGDGTAISATTVNVTGSTNAAVYVTGTVLTTFDGSAFTGNLTVNGDSTITQTLSIKTGSGADTVNFAGAAGSGKVTTISTGAGNDTVVLSAASATSAANVSLGDGNDTLRITNATEFTNADTLDGGAGTDTVELATVRGTQTFDLRASSATGLYNTSSFETIRIAALDNYSSGAGLRVDDGTVALAGGNLNIVVGTDRAALIDASTVTAPTSKVTVSLDSTVTRALSYNVSNGVDSVTGGSGNDTFTVATTAFLQSTDKLSGGSGTDTIIFTDATGDVTVTSAQLGALSSVETISVTPAAGNNFTIQLTDAIVKAGASTVKQSSATASQGTLTVDGSALTSAVKLTGGAGADTLIGGSGNDSFTGNGGADSMVGGAGDDTFTFNLSSSAAAGEVISGGDGTDTLKLTADGSGIATSNSFVTSTLSGLETIDLQRAATATFAGSQLSGATYAITDSATNGTALDGASLIDGTLAVNAIAGGNTNLGGLTFTKNSSGNYLFSHGAAVTGSAIDDIIAGTVLGDTISGGTGNDTISGGSGTDYIVAGNGDTITDFVPTASATATSLRDYLVIQGTIATPTAANIAVASANSANFGSYQVAATTQQVGDGTNKITVTTTGSTLAVGDIAWDLTLTGALQDASKTITATANNDLINVAALDLNNLTALDIVGAAGADTITVSAAQASSGGAAVLSVDGGALGEGNTLVLTGAAAGVLALTLATTGAVGAAVAVTNDANVKTSDFDNLDASAITGNGVTVSTSGNALGSYILGSSLVDTITDGANADTMYLGAGNDIVKIVAAANHATGEIIYGGAGTDYIYYTPTGAETLTLQAGVSMDVISYSTGAGPGNACTLNAAVTIDATLSSGDFDLNKDTGAGIDNTKGLTVIGSSGGNTFTFDTGTDHGGYYYLTTGGGQDVIAITDVTKTVMNDATDQVVIAISDFTAYTDRIKVSTTAFDAITGTGGILSGAAYTAATTGATEGTLETDLATALTAGGGTLIANGAALVTITGASFAGNNATYLILNGATAGFAVSEDTVIALVGQSSTTLTANDFSF